MIYDVAAIKSDGELVRSVGGKYAQILWVGKYQMDEMLSYGGTHFIAMKSFTDPG